MRRKHEIEKGEKLGKMGNEILGTSGRCWELTLGHPRAEWLRSTTWGIDSPTRISHWWELPQDPWLPALWGCLCLGQEGWNGAREEICRSWDGTVSAFWRLCIGELRWAEGTQDGALTLWCYWEVHERIWVSRLILFSWIWKQSILHNISVSSATITKCHRPGGLNNRNLFFTVLEAQKSKIKVPASLVPGEIFLPSL